MLKEEFKYDLLGPCVIGVSVSAEDTVLLKGQNEGRLASQLTHGQEQQDPVLTDVGIRSQFLKGSRLVLLNMNRI